MADAECSTHPAIRSCRPTAWGHIEESQDKTSDVWGRARRHAGGLLLVRTGNRGPSWDVNVGIREGPSYGVLDDCTQKPEAVDHCTAAGLGRKVTGPWKAVKREEALVPDILFPTARRCYGLNLSLLSHSFHCFQSTSWPPTSPHRIPRTR